MLHYNSVARWRLRSGPLFEQVPLRWLKMEVHSSSFFLIKAFFFRKDRKGGGGGGGEVEQANLYLKESLLITVL